MISCRGDFRKARLSARSSLTQARKLERQLLIQSYTHPVSEPDIPSTENENGNQEPPAPVYRSSRHAQQQYQQSSLSEKEQKTVGASNNVTNALRRTHDLIATELFRSEYAQQTLAESSAALKQLDETYTTMDSMLASSRDLLGTLLRSQKSDTWYLQTAMYMLMVTGAWLLFRRILYGPMWWLVWLPLRTVFGVGSKAGSAVMGAEAGESGKVGGVGGDRKVEVEGLPRDLPTVKVGGDKVVGDADSMIERVARVVEEADELGNVGREGHDEDEDQPRNPKKRMWEEPELGTEKETEKEKVNEGQRDEL